MTTKSVTREQFEVRSELEVVHIPTGTVFRAHPYVDPHDRVHRESPLGLVLVEPQDIKRPIVALDLAIAAIGAEPLIEDFADLDLAPAQTESPRLRWWRPRRACLHLRLRLVPSDPSVRAWLRPT